MNTSIPTSSPLEFLNIEPLNPLISKCEIKVLYSGKNRNGTYFSKEVATRMAASLPGVPIVGEYFYEIGDFGDHGEDQIVIDDNGIRFVKETVPYGFVPPDAKIWWRNYIDYDGVEREYLVTEGLLWTGRYPDCKRVIEHGNHQSMEIDGESMRGEWSKVEGEWSKEDNNDREYFIVSDAIFSALCILGQEVEPCFEGSNITRNSGVVYSLNKEDFKEKMLDFIEEIKTTLNTDYMHRGGNEMSDNKDPKFAKNNEEDEKKKKAQEEPDKDENKDEDEDKKKKYSTDENENEDTDNFSKDEDEDEKKKCGFAKDEDEDEDKDDKDDNDEDEDKKKKDSKYNAEELFNKIEVLEKNYSCLETKYSALEKECVALREFKLASDNKEKEDLINSFYMLNDEQKAEVVKNKANFSLDEIEAKLSVICVRNKVNFDLGDDSESKDNTETPITTFNMSGVADSSTPSWLKAVDRIKNK